MSQKKKNPYFRLLLSLSSALLLWLGWPTFPFTFLLFFAFIPLILLEGHIEAGEQRRKGLRLFGYLYLTFVLWNLGTTWWIYHANQPGMFTAVFFNSVFMPFPFLFYRIVKKSVGKKIGYVSLVCFWLAFEYIHLNWDLSWPWLNLGNGLAMWPSLIQWYEFTGILGGTFWILLINVFIHYCFERGFFTHNRSFSQLGLLAFFILFPITYSLILKGKYQNPNQQKLNVAIIQPNIDPYEKFDPRRHETHLDKLLALSEKATREGEPQYIVWPETALQPPSPFVYDKEALEKIIWPKLIGKPTENFEYYGNYKPFEKVHQWLKKHPNITLLTGISGDKIYRDTTYLPQLVRKHPNLGYYLPVNMSAMLDLDHIETYDKSKLVLGAEKIPFPTIFEPLVNALDIHEASNCGVQTEAEVFQGKDSSKVATLICYESVYGAHIGEFVDKGANWIAIITNDAWWYETDGHKQHLLFSVLRSIETRKYIVRSANTGISCFIDPTGKMIKPTKYGESAVIQETIFPNSEETFYTKNKDILGRLAAFLSLVLFFSSVIRKKTQKYA